MTKTICYPVWNFEFEYWNLFVIWNLIFGFFLETFISIYPQNLSK